MTTNRYIGRCQYGCKANLSTEIESNASTHKVDCPTTGCSRYVILRKVEGEFNPDHKCDVRCTSAKGHTCRCACGGANHGSDWGTNPATVMVETPERPTGIHIGSEGKFITGEVILTKIIRNGNMAPTKALYEFSAVNTDATLKWWAPKAYWPDWVEGDRIKLRAKVVCHETHERFGKSTVVMVIVNDSEKLS